MEKSASLAHSRRRRSPLLSAWRHLVLALLSLAVALFLSLLSQVPHFTIQRHAFRPGLGPILLLAGAAYLALLAVWALFSLFWTKAGLRSFSAALAWDFPTYAPVALLLLAPLALSHYLTRGDLLQRLALFAAAVAAAVLYLKAVRAGPARPAGFGRVTAAFSALPLRKRVAALALVSLLLTNAGSLLITGKGVAFGGDEPHYLMMSHSLLKDGDLDLANNYQRADFKAFMPPQVQLHPHVVPGRKAGSLYSFHSPGIALLLLPFYALGLALGQGALVLLVRFGMSLMGAFLGIQIYLYAREAWGRERVAVSLWALVTLTAPVFFYSIHVYPEIVVAGLGLFVFRRLRSAAPLKAAELSWLGLLVASFTWFHSLKYAFIQAPLLLLALWKLRRGGEGKRLRRLVSLLVPAGLCLVVYFLFQRLLYGSFNPTSVSWQGAMDGRQSLSFVKDLFTGIPFRFRWETLAGYFLDQRDGLLFYAPIYAFTFLGVAALRRARFRDTGWLLLVAAPYVLASAFLTQRSGHAPQARPLVAVIWVLAVFLGGFIAEQGRRGCRHLFAVAAGFSLLVTWLLCRTPLALYQETTYGTSERAGTLFLTLSNLHVRLPDFLPSFIKVESGHWPANAWWIGLLALFVAGGLLLRRRDARWPFAGHALAATLLLACFFAQFVLFPRPVLVQPQTAELPTGETWTFYSLSLVTRMGEPAVFAILQDDREYTFYFTTQEPLEKLEVLFGSLHGDYALKLRTADVGAFAERTRRKLARRVIERPPAYRWRGAHLYDISIRLDRKSDVRTAVTPYVFVLRPAR